MMKIASIATVLLLSIAPFALADPLSAEQFKKQLEKLNKERAQYAIDNKIANMHELVYDDQLATDAMKNLGCDLKNQYFALPDGYTIEKYKNQNLERLKKANREQLTWGFNLLTRFDQMRHDPRQSRIGCAVKSCSKSLGVTKDLKRVEDSFGSDATCVVDHPIADPKNSIKKGSPGSQCPKEKNEKNLCVDPEKPASSGSSGSSESEDSESSSEASDSSSSQLAPFFLFSLFIFKFL